MSPTQELMACILRRQRSPIYGVLERTEQGKKKKKERKKKERKKAVEDPRKRHEKNKKNESFKKLKSTESLKIERPKNKPEHLANC